jgi:hypothetical protein
MTYDFVQEKELESCPSRHGRAVSCFVVHVSVNILFLSFLFPLTSSCLPPIPQYQQKQQQHQLPTMTLYYSLVFGLLVFEMVVFMSLIMPLPFTWKRVLLTFISESPVIAKLQYWIKVCISLPSIVFSSFHHGSFPLRNAPALGHFLPAPSFLLPELVHRAPSFSWNLSLELLPSRRIFPPS